MSTDIFSLNDKRTQIGFMNRAIVEASHAAINGEVPVGAIIVNTQGAVLAAAHNQTITRCDPTAHAEILAIRQACAQRGNYRLPGSVLYVTIEPCVMCMGAVVHARMAAVIFGAPDPKWGAAGSLYNFSQDQRLNHRVQISGGVCKQPCIELMQRFFRQRRKQGRLQNQSNKE